MPAPTIDLTLGGGVPKSATIENLESEVNDALSELDSSLRADLQTPIALGYPNYDSTALGLADTTDGETFSVTGATTFDLYRNDAGAATLIASLPLSGAVEDLEAEVDALLAVGSSGYTGTPGGPVANATTANITLSAEQTIDGVLTSTSRILVKDQTAPEENGIYVTAAGAWTRAADMDAAGEFLRKSVYVTGGTVNGGRTYGCASTVTTVGTDAVSFTLLTDQSALSGEIADVRALNIANKPNVSPEITLRNIRTNGDFANGSTGYTGSATRSHPGPGMRLMVSTYNNRSFLSPVMPHAYAAGDRFLFSYQYTIINPVGNASLTFFLRDGADTTITAVPVAWVDGQTVYSGSVILTIPAGRSGEGIKLAGELGLSGGNEINLDYYMLIPIDGALAGFTLPQVEAEIEARGKTGKYFEDGGAARLAILSKRAEVSAAVDDGAVSLAGLDGELRGLPITNLIPSPNLKLGEQGWARSQGTTEWGAYGLRVVQSVDGIEYNSVQMSSAQTMTLAAGHKYAFYADFDCSASSDGLFVDGEFRPYVNTSTNTYSERRFGIGQNGIPLRNRVVSTFTASASGSFQKAIFRFGTFYRDAAGELSGAADSITYTFRTLMLVDLGSDTSNFMHNLYEDQLGIYFDRLGPHWYPTSSFFSRSADAGRAVYAERSEIAGRADSAALADATSYLTTPWYGKKVAFVGDSLVGQQKFQTYVRDALGITTSFGGTSGHPIGPNVSTGFFRKSFSDAIAADTDAIVILAGANDYITETATLISYPVGVYTDPYLTDAQLSAGTLPTTFCQAYNTMRMNIRKRFPNTRVMVCTQMQYFRAYPQGTTAGGWDDIYDGNGGNHSGSREKAQALREMASHWGDPLIDLWKEAGINYWNRRQFLQTEDGGQLWVHPNVAGGKRMAEVIIGRMRDIQPQVYVAGDFGAPGTHP